MWQNKRIPKDAADIREKNRIGNGGGPDLPQQKETRDGKPIAQKGLGYYPISDLQFDVVTLVYEKSKALQAYDLYIRDSQPNPELQAIIEQIAMDDRKHIQMLKDFLGSC